MAIRYSRRRQIIADRVYDVLLAHKGTALGITALASLATLSAAQVSGGLEVLREDPERKDSIVTWRGPGGGVFVTDNTEDVQDHRRQVINEVVAKTRRLFYGAVKPNSVYQIAPVDPVRAQDAIDTFEEAMAKLEALV